MQAAELRDKLNTPTDPNLIRTRRQGGSEISFLEWFEVNRILDQQCPGWSGTVREVYTAGDTVIVSYSISVPTAEGIVTRGAVGSEKLGSGFDPVASAEQQAFKRAAARFGIGLDLYDKAAAAPATAASKPPSTRPPGWEPKWERARA